MNVMHLNNERLPVPSLKYLANSCINRCIYGWTLKTHTHTHCVLHRNTDTHFINGYLNMTAKSKTNQTITKKTNIINRIDFRKYEAHAIRHQTKVGQA